jgi:DME family drug/metabolite transporter
VTAAVLWGSSYPAISVALREAGPLWIALVRGIAQSAIVGIALLLRRPSLPRSERRSWLVLGAVGVLGGFFNVGQSIAVALTGATIVGFVAGLYPLVAGATAPMLAGDRMGRETWMALAICAIGLALIAVPASRSDAEYSGIVVAAIAALAFGIFLPASRRLTSARAIPPLVVTLSVFLGLTLQATAGIAAFRDAGIPEHPSSSFVVALGWLILAAGVVPLVLVQLALRYNPTSTVAPYLFLTPLVSVLLSVLMLGEAVSAPQLLGGGLIVIGLMVQTATNIAAPASKTSGQNAWLE